jgi:hypothetical protein
MLSITPPMQFMSIMINMSPEISNNVGQYKLHNTPDRLLLTTVPLVRTTLTKVLIVIFSLISMLSILLYFNCWGQSGIKHLKQMKLNLCFCSPIRDIEIPLLILPLVGPLLEIKNLPL